MAKTQREQIREDIEYSLYHEMCSGCPNAWRCHEECENCDEFENELYKQYKKYGVNKDYEIPFMED